MPPLTSLVPQGNEIEAMRHWRSALEQIYDHNANKALPAYAPRSDTEKALIEALKELELQCKERIDLLEALRVSRQENPSMGSSGKLTKTPDCQGASARSPGSIGQGTIPAVTYSELSRPSLPQRPSLPTRTSSEAATIHGATSNRSYGVGLNIPFPSLAKSTSKDKLPETDQTARSSSPDKYTMRTTLRSGKSNEKPSKASRKSSRPPGEGSSKAATLAWSALTSGDKANRNAKSSSDRPSVSPILSQRHSSEQPRKPVSSHLHWDSHSRRLVPTHDTDSGANNGDSSKTIRHSDEYPRPSFLSVSAASSALTSSAQDLPYSSQTSSRSERYPNSRKTPLSASPAPATRTPRGEQRNDNGTGDDSGELSERRGANRTPARRKPVPRPLDDDHQPSKDSSEHAKRTRPREQPPKLPPPTSSSSDDDYFNAKPRASDAKQANDGTPNLSSHEASEESAEELSSDEQLAWKKKKETILKNLPPGVDDSAAKQILNDIVVKGDEVHWSDIAGLEIAKNALREAVVYPFLRPDLFMGLREPARGMLLFGPPGTGKTMLARAVATESKSTFFSISASSLTSKFLGESEKLVRALFSLAKVLAPSIIFVDEIDSLLSQRSGSGEHEATRRIKTEFLIQWSDLQRAAAGRETTDKDKERGDANRVLVLAATNLPWAIDEAARRRFVRRQYIPLPEPTTRETQLRTLLGQQKHNLSSEEIWTLVELTDGGFCTYDKLDLQ